MTVHVVISFLPQFHVEFRSTSANYFSHIYLVLSNSGRLIKREYGAGFPDYESSTMANLNQPLISSLPLFPTNVNLTQFVPITLTITEHLCLGGLSLLPFQLLLGYWPSLMGPFPLPTLILLVVLALVKSIFSACIR